jgi:hypothetical protein
MTTRPYRLELDGMPFSTVTYTTEAKAREVALDLNNRLWLKSGQKWRITLRAAKGRTTTVVAEGVVR